MNKAYKYWLSALFTFVLTVQAQTDKLLGNYKPVIDLMVQVVALLEMETTTKLTLSTEQATLLAPMLRFLQTSDTLTNDESLSYQTQLVQNILSLDQRDWLLERMGKVSEELFNSQSRPPGGLELAIRLMRGEPVNLVKEGPAKDALNELAELVVAKAS